MNGKPSLAPFLTALGGFVVAGSVLLQLIPVLFGPHEMWHERAACVLAVVVAVLGVIMTTLRPRRDGSQIGRSDPAP